jgi:hypothetical protein
VYLKTLKNKIMTRQEFESGVKFTTKKTLDSEIFEFKQYEGPLSGYISERYAGHFANIKKITDKGFHFFKYVFDKNAKGIIKFSECEVVTDNKQ